MSAQVLDCRLVADWILESCKQWSDRLRSTKDLDPTLAILRLGENAADLSYERGATRTMERAGISVRPFALPQGASQEEYERALAKLASDPDVHGILPLRPLPGMDDDEIIARLLPPAKDVDGTTPENLGRILGGDLSGLMPCTAAAVLDVVFFYGEEIKRHVSEKFKPLPFVEEVIGDNPCYGLDVCIVNRSNVVGKPLAAMLLAWGASVSVVHRRTHEETMRDYTRRADLLVAAAPQKDAITADMVAEGAVVIDVATIYEEARDENGECIRDEKTGNPKIRVSGCCAQDVAEKASYITPVPGMGAVTSAVLARNVLQAAQSTLRPA